MLRLMVKLNHPKEGSCTSPNDRKHPERFLADTILMSTGSFFINTHRDKCNDINKDKIDYNSQDASLPIKYVKKPPSVTENG